MPDTKLPDHLQGLEKELNRIHTSEPDDAAYAEIAFSLIKAGEGDKDSLVKISDYIQRQHQQLKNKHETIVLTKSRVASWLMWAENWTMKKESKS